MGGQHRVLQRLEPIRNKRFLFVDVECRARNRAVLQGFDQGCLIDGNPARYVDEMALWTKSAQNPGIDRVPRLAAGADRDHQDVCPFGKAEQAVVILIWQLRPRRAIVIADRHVEGRCTRRNALADGAQPENSKLAPCQARHMRHALDPITLPAAGSQEAFGGTDLSGARQHQSHSEFGDARRIGIGGIADQNATRPGGGPLDPLVARAVAGDETEIGQGFDQSGVRFPAAYRQEHPCRGRSGRQRVRRGMCHRPEHFVSLLQTREQARRHAWRHQDRRLHG